MSPKSRRDRPLSQLRLAREGASDQGIHPYPRSSFECGREQVRRERARHGSDGQVDACLGRAERFFFSSFSAPILLFLVWSCLFIVFGLLVLMSSARRPGSRPRGVLIARLGSVNSPPKNIGDPDVFEAYGAFRALLPCRQPASRCSPAFPDNK